MRGGRDLFDVEGLLNGGRSKQAWNDLGRAVMDGATLTRRAITWPRVEEFPDRQRMQVRQEDLSEQTILLGMCRRRSEKRGEDLKTRLQRVTVPMECSKCSIAKPVETDGSGLLIELTSGSESTYWLCGECVKAFPSYQRAQAVFFAWMTRRETTGERGWWGL